MTIALVITVMLCIALICVAGYLSVKLGEERVKLATTEERLNQSRAELEKSKVEIDNLKAETEQKKKERQELQQENERNFKLIANEILQQQSLSLQNSNENRLNEILKPLKSDIERFRKDVNDCYSAEARERFSLQEKIKELIDANASISKEAKDLSTALRGNSKVQGDWGEMVLETILEKSGLNKGEEYYTQLQSDAEGRSLRDESGRGLRPDVVINYPGTDGGVMVIDSKVSLTAFVNYINAETEQERETYGEQHLASVIKHINELSEKRYQDYVGKRHLEFVMMFVPNEAAYSAAVTLDPALWQRAYDKRVLIVSPTQLVGALRLIKQLWTQEAQSRNAFKIAEQSGAMYDKFVGFVNDMLRVEKNLNQAHSAYDDAMKKLKTGRGNLISRAQKLKDLGINNTKELPESETSEMIEEDTE